jgi:hypothetical protein
VRFRIGRADGLFGLSVLLAYVLAMLVSMSVDTINPDPMMLVAERALGGNLNSDALKGVVDSVYFNGHYYMALGPLQLLPYLPFAAVPALQGIGRYLIGLLFGVLAAWLSLPLARSLGAKGSTGFWISSFTAFGSILLYVSVVGDMYYLAHAESFLALTIFLIEWQGRRREWLLGSMLALSFLARPTTVVAAAPFGLMLLWRQRLTIGVAVRKSIAFAIPIAVAVAVYGWFNWVRFGSPLESGYAISYVSQPELLARRAQGLFSVTQIPENVRLALFALPGVIDSFPFIVPSRWGLSMLLVSPALLTSAWAGFRDHLARLLWVAAALVAVPVFLYYGGGFAQFGFRYSLDFTPFLVALMALGSPRWHGRPERLLVIASIGLSYFGLLYVIAWHAPLPK